MTTITPVGGGMSGAVLRGVRREPPAIDLLLRLFQHSSMSQVERESTHQRHAGSGGVPVPEVSFVRQDNSCPVMGWVEGRTMIEQRLHMTRLG